MWNETWCIFPLDYYRVFLKLTIVWLRNTREKRWERRTETWLWRNMLKFLFVWVIFPFFFGISLEFLAKADVFLSEGAEYSPQAPPAYVSPPPYTSQPNAPPPPAGPQGYGPQPYPTRQQPSYGSTVVLVEHDHCLSGNPVGMQCPSCKVFIHTSVDYTPGTLAWLIGIFLCVFG